MNNTGGFPMNPFMNITGGFPGNMTPEESMLLLMNMNSMDFNTTNMTDFEGNGNFSDMGNFTFTMPLMNMTDYNSQMEDLLTNMTNFNSQMENLQTKFNVSLID